MYSAIGKITTKLVMCYVGYKVGMKLGDLMYDKMCKQQAKKIKRRTTKNGIIYTTFVEGD